MSFVGQASFQSSTSAILKPFSTWRERCVFNTGVTMLCCIWSIVKETGITLVIFMLKDMAIINCSVTRWQFNRGNLLQWISHLGNPNSDHVLLIEVTVQLRPNLQWIWEADFGKLIGECLIEGDCLIEVWLYVVQPGIELGSLNRSSYPGQKFLGRCCSIFFNFLVPSKNRATFSKMSGRSPSTLP